MNYYISDLHLFHKNVTGAGKDGRPFDNLEEMHSLIKENMENKNHEWGYGIYPWRHSYARNTGRFDCFCINIKRT